MSYSFPVRASSKSEAKALVAAGLDEVCRAQPVHHRDRIAAYAAAVAFIDLLADAEGKDVVVHVSGSLSYSSLEAAPRDFGETRGTSIGVDAYLAARDE